MSTPRTRFAPSPTGPLHLGHAYAARVAHDLAAALGGQFLLRIEDLDRARSRPEWESLIQEDLHWLGLRWHGPVLRQSDRIAAYTAALDRLGRMGVVFPCACSRADIRAAHSAPQEGDPPFGPDGVVYPGTCRNRLWTSRQPGEALRLSMARALDILGHVPRYRETGVAQNPDLNAADLRDGIGDAVLCRRASGDVAYHLAVVVDDAAQGITHVTRGADLADATPLHRVLQELLGLPAPIYHHHGLIRDDKSKRLAKRDDSRALRLYRADGKTPEDIWRLIGAQPSGAINSTSAPSRTAV